MYSGSTRGDGARRTGTERVAPCAAGTGAVDIASGVLDDEGIHQDASVRTEGGPRVAGRASSHGDAMPAATLTRLALHHDPKQCLTAPPAMLMLFLRLNDVMRPLSRLGV